MNTTGADEHVLEIERRNCGITEIFCAVRSRVPQFKKYPNIVIIEISR